MKNKIILSLLLVCALAMPVFAKAITADDLKAQISALQAQIAQLLAQLAQIQSGTTAWCHTFNTNLGIGSSGEDIKPLQEALIKDGSMVPPDNTVGYSALNEYIASAVTGFQEKYASEILKPLGLKHGTGYLGNSTRAKLNKLYGCGATACTTEAQDCPDGSYVSRTGPNCEFAKCPIASCVSEGGVEGNSGYQCCAGLTAITSASAPCPPAPISCEINFYYCARCGNGICGIGENAYSCPSDCKNKIVGN